MLYLKGDPLNLKLESCPLTRCLLMGDPYFPRGRARAAPVTAKLSYSLRGGHEKNRFIVSLDKFLTGVKQFPSSFITLSLNRASN